MKLSEDNVRLRSAIGLVTGLLVAGAMGCVAFADDAPVVPLTAEQVVQRNRCAATRRPALTPTWRPDAAAS